MSWQLVSTVVVCVALAGGFGWYERSRPPSKLLALVAALAALATAGRIVFAPIPNVQATTDVALLAGYALGAGPGFAVGAVGALASNFFLGQGPWTPWQMLGWGAVGVAGATLARFPLRRGPGRLLLAFACALAGLAFGAWMDLFTTVTFAAEQSLDSYFAISAASLPFNLAHAIGNALLCAMLGPSMLRLLLRFRVRFEVDWRPLPSPRASAAGHGAAIAVLASALALAGATAPRAEAAGVRDALRYLEQAQNADGGFGAAPGQRSSELLTGWAILGLEAGGRHPGEVRRGGRTAIDYLRSRVRGISDTGELERTILALRGAGVEVRDFGGQPLLARLVARRRSDGSFDGLVNLTAFGILALRAAGRESDAAPVARAAAWLEREQNRDGGFSSSQRGGASDVDDTGAVLQALAAAGRARSGAVRKAVGYLREQHNADGGFGQLARSRSNAQSTAWAVQGLVAVARDPARFGADGRRSPIAYLASLQQRDGSFRYSRTSAQTPVWVTAQAIAGLRQRPFPLRPVARRARPQRAAARRPDERPHRRARSASGDRDRPRPKSRGSTGAPFETPPLERAAERSGAAPKERRSGGRGPWLELLAGAATAAAGVWLLRALRARG